MRHGRVCLVGTPLDCLDQLTAVVQPDQLAVGAGIQVLAQKLARDRIQRLGDLDVEVTVHLDRGEHRGVISGRHAQQGAGLLLGEHLQGPGLGGAMDAHPGPLPTPQLHLL